MEQPYRIDDLPVTHKKGTWKKLIVALLAGVFVFVTGVGVGNGTISFSGVGKQSTQHNLPSQLNYSSVNQVYDALRRSFDGELNEEKLIEGLKKGLVGAAGDPYTEYLNAEQTKELDEDLSGTFSGIGAELGKDGDSIVIVAPIKGFPADKAGLKSRDIITEINDEPAFGLSVTEAVSKIRGQEGTKIKLTVIRDQKELTFDITRAQITIPSVEYEMKPSKIGYIKISRFSEDTAALTKKAANELKQQGAKGVVLDVRSNPGGLLDAAVDVSSLWLPNNKVVLEEKRGGVTVKDFRASGVSVLQGIPTIVLVDGGSASASEIVAGALRDNKVATLLGEKTFGKGSVQQIERLPGGGSLKVTIARWFTPNGRNIDKEGIEPDKKIEQKDSKGDNQLEAALKQLQLGL